MILINPFIPHHPSAAGNFVGRRSELRRLEASLLHAIQEKPINFMLTGERGVGKTSLLNYVQSMARRIDSSESQAFNFLVVQVQIDRSTTLLDLVRKIEGALRKELDRNEPARKFLVQSWGFLRRLEVAGISIREETEKPSLMWEDFADTLLQTVRRVCRPDHPETGFVGINFDGLLLLMDEVDTANSELQLGAFLKCLTEYLQRGGCNRLIIGLSGLPQMVDVILRSHPSALRVFEDLRLSRLPRNEVRELVDTFLLTAQQDNRRLFEMDQSAFDLVMELSEGHPHFVQQICYCGFNAMMNRGFDSSMHVRGETRAGGFVVTREDVAMGAFSPRGAIDVIGDIYYRHAVDALTSSELHVLSRMSYCPGQSFAAEQLAEEADISMDSAQKIMLALASRGLVSKSAGRPETISAHQCLSHWLQSIGLGNQITIEAE